MREYKHPYHTGFNPMWMIFGIVGLVIIPFFVWASYARLDQISHARGQVIASAKTQEIVITSYSIHYTKLYEG